MMKNESRFTCLALILTGVGVSAFANSSLTPATTPTQVVQCVQPNYVVGTYPPPSPTAPSSKPSNSGNHTKPTVLPWECNSTTYDYSVPGGQDAYGSSNLYRIAVECVGSVTPSSSTANSSGSVEIKFIPESFTINTNGSGGCGTYVAGFTTWLHKTTYGTYASFNAGNTCASDYSQEIQVADISCDLNWRGVAGGVSLGGTMGANHAVPYPKVTVNNKSDTPRKIKNAAWYGDVTSGQIET